jgi:F-type H+-transporting ATPase subunit b
MEATLHALGELLLEAVPTILFFIFLNLFLKQVFFKPLGRILEERKKATEGVRALAQRAFESAGQKASDVVKALQLARQEINAENDKLRKQWLSEQSEALAHARADADRKLEAARQQIAAEIAHADSAMETQIDAIANAVLDSLTRRRAA